MIFIRKREREKINTITEQSLNDDWIEFSIVQK